MRYALLVLVLSILACRVEGVDYDADLWTDGDVEADADPFDAAWCSYQAICGGVECSRRGVCEVVTCRPSCWCWVGYHAGGEDGLECLAD